MDAELKTLLRGIAAKLEGIEKRLTTLEATAHKQVTMEDILKRAKTVTRHTPRSRFEDMRIC